MKPAPVLANHRLLIGAKLSFYVYHRKSGNDLYRAAHKHCSGD